jgi:hypothetical protein
VEQRKFRPLDINFEERDAQFRCDAIIQALDLDDQLLHSFAMFPLRAVDEAAPRRIVSQNMKRGCAFEVAQRYLFYDNFRELGSQSPA